MKTRWLGALAGMAMMATICFFASLILYFITWGELFAQFIYSRMMFRLFLVLLVLGFFFGYFIGKGEEGK